tara:strand:+ start:146 stop:334 length:189 start_codon:yes stop_codon:yes gene_type:complete
MIIEKKYKCQHCFQNNSINIELSYCSEISDNIEDCTVCCHPNTISYISENNKIVFFEISKTY